MKVKADIVATKERVAVAESTFVVHLHRVRDQLERFRHLDRKNAARPPHSDSFADYQRSAWSTQASPRQRETGRTRPLLHVFGDSFVGPFTLYQPSEVGVTKYKGASAQGLGNPSSALQVGRDLARRLRDYMTAPGNRSKAALLMFGSVDLHINHLHHVTTRSIARHLPLEQRKESAVPFEDQAMTGVEYAQRAFESYRRFLLTAIVRSEIGDYVREHALERTPPRIMVAAAAPPMVEDEYLEAIRLKYILPHQSKPKDWAEKEPSPSPQSSPSPSATASRASTPSSSCSSLSSSVSSTVDTPLSVRDILEHKLGLLDKVSRTQATRHFNSALRDFCKQHNDVLRFVDITPSMALPGPTRAASEATVGHDVDRARFGDKADPTNVHVDWEATLPLWEEELSWEQVPVHEFKYRTALEETARAFNAEKSERVKRRSWRLETTVLPRDKAKKVEVSVMVEPVCDEPFSAMPECGPQWPNQQHLPPRAKEYEDQKYGQPTQVLVTAAREWSAEAARNMATRPPQQPTPSPHDLRQDRVEGW